MMYVGVQYTQLDTRYEQPSVGMYVIPVAIGGFQFDYAGIDYGSGLGPTSYHGVQVAFSGNIGFIFGRPNASGTMKAVFGKNNYGHIEVNIEVRSNVEYGYAHYSHDFSNGDYKTYSYPLNCRTGIPYLLWDNPIDISSEDVGSTPSLVNNSKYYRFVNFEYNNSTYTDYNLYFTVNTVGDLYFHTNLAIWQFHVHIYRKNADHSDDEVSDTVVDSGTMVTLDATQSKGVAMTHYNYENTWTLAWRYHSTTYIPDTQSVQVTLNCGDIVFYPTTVGKEYVTQFDSDGGTLASSVTSTYPNKITLPSSTKQYYTLLGWEINNVTYPAGTQYQPVGNDTLVAQWKGTDYTVNYVQADGTVVTRTITYNNNDTNVRPTPTSYSQYFTFVGWDYNGTVYDNNTPFQPTADSTLYARYSFTRTLDKDGGTWSGSGQEPTFISGFFEAESIPSVNLPVDYTKSGYSFVGWKPSNGSTAYENNVYVPALTDNFTQLTALWTNKPLRSLTLKDAENPPNVLNRLVLSYCETDITVQTEETFVDTAIVNVALDPEDWGGTGIEWDISRPEDRGSYFNIVQGTRDGGNLPYTFSIIQQSDVAYQITAKYGSIQSTNTMELILQYVYMVDFVIKQTQNTFKMVAKRTVENGTPKNVWVTTMFPDNPHVDGYDFQYWVDDLGNIVNVNNPPPHGTVCTAIFSKIHGEDQTNHLIIQRFNSDGDAIIMQMDIDVALSFTDTFTPKIIDFATPTMTSASTFITDMAVTESITFEFIRKTPKVIDDESADMSKWSNRKWIMALRSLVDRWQSDTDGIRIIFLPTNLHRIQSVKKNVTIDGQTVEVETIPMAGELVGLDYDFIGYENKGQFGVNVGYLYDIGEEHPILLVGDNCLINSYEDDFEARNVTAVRGTIGLHVGGLTSNYKGNI